MEKWISTQGVLMRDAGGRLHYREPTAEQDRNISDDPVGQLARAAEVDEDWQLQGEESDWDEEEDEHDEPEGLDALVTATLGMDWARSESAEPALLIPQHLRLHPLFAQLSTN